MRAVTIERDENPFVPLDTTARILPDMLRKKNEKHFFQAADPSQGEVLFNWRLIETIYGGYKRVLTLE